MDRNDFFYLGKILKTSGFQGDLMFFFDVDDLEPYKNLEAVFIDIQGDLVPFAIRSLHLKTGNTFITSLEEVTSEKQAQALTGCQLFLPNSFLPELTGKNFYYHEITGYRVKDSKHGDIGRVDHVLDQGKQAILVIKKNEKEILVPVSDEIILLIDRKEKLIELDCPEGLIDLYL